MANVLVQTAGTAVPLTTGGPLPIDHGCTRTTLVWLSTNAGNVSVGLPPPATGSNVTKSTAATPVQDHILNAANPSITIGAGNRKGDSVERHLIYINADNNNDGVAEIPEWN